MFAIGQKRPKVLCRSKSKQNTENPELLCKPDELGACFSCDGLRLGAPYTFSTEGELMSKCDPQGKMVYPRTDINQPSECEHSVHRVCSPSRNRRRS